MDSEVATAAIQVFVIATFGLMLAGFCLVKAVPMLVAVDAYGWPWVPALYVLIGAGALVGAYAAIRLSLEVLLGID